MENPDQAGPVSSIRLVRLGPAVMELLVAGDRAAASARTGLEISDYLAGEECAWLWRIRLRQVAEDPDSAEWVARAAVSEPDGAVVGHAGFHGPPDETGTVEVGYSVDPAFRRRGHARAMLGELLRWAADDPRVRTVRASIRPDNAASLAIIAGFGFARTGEQWDDEDGLETIFEVRV
jgi:[ribosomal protein S5]-alanine N-acetyltransferase